MFSTVFSTVNGIFLLEDLLLGKKSVYMKNAKERAGFKIFGESRETEAFPIKTCKNHKKTVQIIYCVVP